MHAKLTGKLCQPEKSLKEQEMSGKLRSLIIILGLKVSVAAGLISLPSHSLAETNIVFAKHKTVMGDNDSNFAGQKAAYSLANRLILNNYVVEVNIPEIVGDWNDELVRWSKNNRQDDQKDIPF